MAEIQSIRPVHATHCILLAAYDMVQAHMANVLLRLLPCPENMMTNGPVSPQINDLIVAPQSSYGLPLALTHPVLPLISAVMKCAQAATLRLHLKRNENS